MTFMAVILRYFSEFWYLPGALRKSSRLLSHLLMSSCLYMGFGADLLKNVVSGAWKLPKSEFAHL